MCPTWYDDATFWCSSYSAMLSPLPSPKTLISHLSLVLTFMVCVVIACAYAISWTFLLHTFKVLARSPAASSLLLFHVLPFATTTSCSIFWFQNLIWLFLQLYFVSHSLEPNKLNVPLPLSMMIFNFFICTTLVCQIWFLLTTSQNCVRLHLGLLWA